MNKTCVSSTMALVIACVSWAACAEDRADPTDRISGGAKLTKADAARSAQRGENLTNVPAGAAASAGYAATGRTAQPQRPTVELKGDSEDETTGRVMGKGVKNKGTSTSLRLGTAAAHSTSSAPSGQGAGGEPEQRPGHDPLKTKHDTAKNSINNIR